MWHTYMCPHSEVSCAPLGVNISLQNFHDIVREINGTKYLLKSVALYVFLGTMFGVVGLCICVSNPLFPSLWKMQLSTFLSSTHAYHDSEKKKRLGLGAISSVRNPQEHLLCARNCPVSRGFHCRKQICCCV